MSIRSNVLLNFGLLAAICVSVSHAIQYPVTANITAASINGVANQDSSIFVHIGIGCPSKFCESNCNLSRSRMSDTENILLDSFRLTDDTSFFQANTASTYCRVTTFSLCSSGAYPPSWFPSICSRSTDTWTFNKNVVITGITIQGPPSVGAIGWVSLLT